MTTSSKRASPIDPLAVAERLEAIRNAFGFEKGDFARSVGIDPSSYSKIIAGEKPLNLNMGFNVSERWGVPMDYIYRGRLADLPDKLIRHLRES